MIGIHDLHDISAVFTRMRSDIEYDKNTAILQAIKTVLSVEYGYENNQIRNAISKIPHIDAEKWYFAFHENLYMYDAVLKKKSITELLVKVCDELFSVLMSNHFNIALDLVDAVHCLPNIIAENRFSIPKSYWKSHITLYRKKWDKGFLVYEQKSLK